MFGHQRIYYNLTNMIQMCDSKRKWKCDNQSGQKEMPWMKKHQNILNSIVHWGLKLIKSGNTQPMNVTLNTPFLIT